MSYMSEGQEMREDSFLRFPRLTLQLLNSKKYKEKRCESHTKFKQKNLNDGDDVKRGKTINSLLSCFK